MVLRRYVATMLTLVSLITLLLVAAGCEGGTHGGASSTGQITGQQVVSGKAARVAFITINLQAIFFNQMLAGVKKAAQDGNASLFVFNANNDQSAENNAIDDYIQEKVDAIIVDAIDVNGVKPAIERASQAHIPVIAVDAIVQDPAVKVQVGVDNCQAAQQLADYFNTWMSHKGLAHPKVGIVGALNSFIQNERKDCFTRAVEREGAVIVQTVDGQNQVEVAQTAAQNLYTANPGMDAVYATGEPALKGAIAAARSQQRTAVPIFGWDLSKEAIAGIDDGFVVAVVQQDPYTEGVRSVQAALDLKASRPVPATINVPVTIVTKSNVDRYRSQFAQASLQEPLDVV